MEFDARNFRGLDFQDGAQRYAVDGEAERKAEGQDHGRAGRPSPQKTLPAESEDKEDWNSGSSSPSLLLLGQVRQHPLASGHSCDRELKQIGRDQLDTFLSEKVARRSTKSILVQAASSLKPSTDSAAACGWVKNKFGIEIPVESVREAPAEEFKRLVYEKAEAAYREKEIEYPVMVGLSHFTARDASGHKR